MRMAIKKRKKPIPFNVPSKRREGDVRSVRAQEKWINLKHCTLTKYEGIWWNFEISKKLGSQGSSKLLRFLFNYFGID